MPLKKGRSQAVIDFNIAKMRHEGYPEEQAVAASMRNAGKPNPKKKKAKKRQKKALF